MIPPGLLEDVLAKAEKAAEVDEKVRIDLEEGKRVSESRLKWRGKAP